MKDRYRDRVSGYTRYVINPTDVGLIQFFNLISNNESWFTFMANYVFLDWHDSICERKRGIC